MRSSLRALVHPVRAASALRARLLRRWAQPEPVLIRAAGAYWAESDRSEERRDLSHWRGVGRWGEAEWLDIGRRNLARYRRLVAATEDAGPVGRLLEWGPGGGANAVAFASVASSLVGVDISAANLAECARQAAGAGGAPFTPICIDPDRPESIAERLPHGVDGVLSTAVFQHFPSAAYGARVLGTLARVLRAGGRGLVQIRYEGDSAAFRSKHRDYARHAVTFTSHGIEEFWQAVERAGLVPLWVELEPHAHYAYYAFQRP